MLRYIEDNKYKLIKQVISMQHKGFSDALAKSLRKFYGGEIPSFSTIARDFALHSPAGLAPISVETPRKWIRGESLPSLERLQTLAHWLGPEILESLNGEFLGNKKEHGYGKLTPASGVEDATELLKQLTAEELGSVAQLLRHLVNAHTSPNGKDR